MVFKQIQKKHYRCQNFLEFGFCLYQLGLGPTILYEEVDMKKEPQYAYRYISGFTFATNVIKYKNVIYKATFI